MPSDRTPSSFVTRIRGMRIPNYITRMTSAAAATATTAPVANAISGPIDVQSQPNSQTRGERADAKQSVVDPERRALCLRRRQIGDERLLRSFRQAEVHAVRDEQRDERGGAVEVREAGVDDRVPQPSGDDEPLAAEPIRQPAAVDRTKTT